MKILPLALCLAVLAAAPVAGALASEPANTEPERQERWNQIAQYLFGDRKVEPTETLIKLDAPKRAQDAALVPITLTMPEKDEIKSVYLVIDDNPAPFAAKFTFGPAADAGSVQLRVRVDTYTNVHAVAETKDGKLFETAAFVKASGGCSAPVAASDAKAMEGMGQMRMKFVEGAAAGKPVEATLMIRHPNFNGMQKNPITQYFTPPRYINKMSVSSGDAKVFDLEADISLSTNPVITFSFVPNGREPLKVVASDTKDGHWEQGFDIPAAMN
ncbi:MULTISPECIES: quinoprotein dehydrogenase-associated SoxYZ-like carrier [unclassified Mesorhizobium]|uniref:quinoprotein dehydrogenase-associated SoxYZ-like carrier n=1 Tax=unclassified Mesorhizobium TaxID=325217 RepID=UPI00112948FC|nr:MULTISPECIES: quinoprotein dehydrogenase-associated SoxYZ-like carrier [unclassified Mesorhizobium]TPL05237.1 quinoprotein dehydrogenase-associated SoxYZ-like carrier [Mesorhizobium sp. B2-4-16]TPL74611.1 quinoprotein dehydrogenase-associated SoxYZ-like carrier [Mesorhizobium sp. B2-4-3]